MKEEGALFSGDAVPAANTLLIYVDPRECIEWIKKLQKVPDVNHLLSSWHDPLKGHAIPPVMEEAIRYIERIDAIIVDLEKTMGSASLEEMSVRALDRLGIKVPKVPRLVMTSFKAHLRRKQP